MAQRPARKRIALNMKDCRGWTMCLTQILHRSAHSLPNKAALVSGTMRLCHAAS